MTTARSEATSLLSSTCMLAVVSIGTISFGAGWFLASSTTHRDNHSEQQQQQQQRQEDNQSASQQTSKRQQQQQGSETITNQQQYYCECGFDLTGKSQYHQAQHRSGRLHRVNLYRGSKAPILVTAKVNEYRAAIATHVNPTDIVMEIGCAEGLTTQRLAQRAKIAIGIDQNPTLIEKGQTRVFQKHQDNRDENDKDSQQEEYSWSNLFLHTADAFDKSDLIKIVDDVINKMNCADDFKETHENDEESVLADAITMTTTTNGTSSSFEDKGNIDERGISSDAHINTTQTKTTMMSKREKRNLRDSLWWGKHGRNKHAGKVTKIWIDISGSRELRTVVHLIDIVESLFQPELIVVKSDNLKNLIRRTYLPSAHIPGLTAGTPRSKEYIIR